MYDIPSQRKYTKIRIGGKALRMNPDSYRIDDGQGISDVPTAGGALSRLQMTNRTTRRLSFQVYLNDNAYVDGKYKVGDTVDVINHLGKFLPEDNLLLAYAPPRVCTVTLGQTVHKCYLETMSVDVQGTDIYLKPNKALVDLTFVIIPRTPTLRK